MLMAFISICYGMHIEIEFEDEDLLEHFNSVDIPARSYVAKQLIRLGLQSGGNPLIQAKAPPKKEIPQPEFDHSSKEKKKPFTVEKHTTTGPMKIKTLSKDERKAKLKIKLGNL